MARIAGKHALLKMFEAEGVKYMFGNPGTSEAPMMAVMRPNAGGTPLAMAMPILRGSAIRKTTNEGARLSVNLELPICVGLAQVGRWPHKKRSLLPG